MKHIKYIFENLYVYILNLFIHRDEDIVIFGAWMGTKFADNPRFLFQFLNDNKKTLGLKKVIWITRNEEVKRILDVLGYECYMCGTKESKYWHLKSGIHIICNTSDRTHYDPDIDIQYSWGAKKIQLWHGVGMKSVGRSANEYKSSPIKAFLLKSRLLHSITTEGGWGESYFLATSEIKAKTNREMVGCSEKSMFISNYARNCECLKLLPKEEEVIQSIKKYNKRIIYLPTFRKDYTGYVHPLQDSKIQKVLEENNILWIEKPHFAATFKDTPGNLSTNVLYLDSDFDINVIYKYMDIVISDFSSASFDAVYRRIPLIMYVPDYNEFKDGNIGFSIDVNEYCHSFMAFDVDQCIELINKICLKEYFTSERTKKYNNIINDFWSNQQPSYQKIWDDIKSL